MGGATCARNVAAIYWNLTTDWAIMAMRVACAAHSAGKKLSVGFEANEIMCLAEILKQQQPDLRNILTKGKKPDT